MSTVSPTDVLIVGAGPVGLALAAALAAQGVRCRIIDLAQGPTPYSKAVGIHSRTLESMHGLQIADQLAADGNPMRDFRVNEGGRAIMTGSFAGVPSLYNFVLGLPQSRTERRLLARLEQLGGAVEWQTKLLEVLSCGSPDGELARVRVGGAKGDEEILCRWLIGADGSRSAVRELSGITFSGDHYGTSFILGDVKLDWDGPREQLQFFLSANGYLLVVPMPEGLHRIIAQLDRRYSDFQTEQRPQATLEGLQQIVDRNGPGGMRLHTPRWLSCAPFYHRCAGQAIRGRTILAGDAFHLFSPLGAQGLNTGFQDAFNLAWKLAYLLKGWADLALVATYETERMAIARKIAAVTSKTTRFITATRWHQRLLRRTLTPWYNRTDKVQRGLPLLLSGALQAYGTDAALSGPAEAGWPQPGARVIDALLPTADGYAPLAHWLHGTQFTLLLLSPQLDALALEQLRAFWTAARRRQLPFLKILLVARELPVPPAVAGAGVEIIEDRLASLFAALRVNTAGLVLVRPDGYCAMSAARWPFEQVTDYFCRRGLGVRAGDESESIEDAA